MTIVKDTAGLFFSVTPTPGIDHAWLGVPVKPTKTGFIEKAKATARLIRKAGCTIVSQN